MFSSTKDSSIQNFIFFLKQTITLTGEYIIVSIGLWKMGGRRGQRRVFMRRFCVSLLSVPLPSSSPHLWCPWWCVHPLSWEHCFWQVPSSEFSLLPLVFHLCRHCCFEQEYYNFTVDISVFYPRLEFCYYHCLQFP